MNNVCALHSECVCVNRCKYVCVCVCTVCMCEGVCVNVFIHSCSTCIGNVV